MPAVVTSRRRNFNILLVKYRFVIADLSKFTTDLPKNRRPFPLLGLVCFVKSISRIEIKGSNHNLDQTTILFRTKEGDLVTKINIHFVSAVLNLTKSILTDASSFHYPGKKPSRMCCSICWFKKGCLFM